MTVGSVTARSHGGVTAIRFKPALSGISQAKTKITAHRGWQTGKVTKVPFAVSTRHVGLATRAAQKVALRQMASVALGAALRAPSVVTLAVHTFIFLYGRAVPKNWPGWDNINPVYRSPPQEPLGKVPGQYIGNPFDYTPGWNGPSRIALLDADDAGLPFGIRFWGDMPGFDPAPDPFPLRPHPENLFPPQPQPAPAPQPEPERWPRYNRQVDRSPRLRSSPRWNPRSNIAVNINVGASGQMPKVWVTHNVVRARGRDDKAKPADQFVYAVLKTLANGLGETKEWIDILGEASGYRRGAGDQNHLLPASIRKGHETVAQAYWLFVLGGINNIDFDELADLVIENEIEDFLIGIAGQMSKFAGRRLGLSVGPQTGLAM